MLKIRDMSVQYGEKPPAVAHFDLHMKKHEIISVVGESGSGKTTVIRSILGLLPGNGRVTRGELLFDEEPLLQKTPEDWRDLRGSRIAMIFQDSGTREEVILHPRQEYTKELVAAVPELGGARFV